MEAVPAGPGSCTLVMTARFHPTGLPGLLYWYSLVPFHNQIFRKMPREIVRRAEWLALLSTKQCSEPGETETAGD